MTKKKMGLIPDPIDERDYRVKGDLLLETSAIFDLPSSVDYSPDLSPVKDQGSRGSCVAFATCAVREWQESAEYLKEIREGSEYERDPVYDLSELYLYSRCKEEDNFPGQEGTSIRMAMKIMQKEGTPQEKAWPYNESMSGQPESWAEMTARWRQIERYYRIGSLDEARKVLFSGGPFVSGIYCFRGIFTTENGTVPMPDSGETPLGGHAICICGYDDSKRLLKFKNSWSDRWGDRGYGYLHYDYFEKFGLDNWFPVDKNVKKLFR